MKGVEDIQTPDDVENSCSNCKRYIGPIVTCPFCGHRTKRRSVIGVTKNAALVVAVVGLLLLHIWSMSYGVPTMNIEDLSETANYAYVEISAVGLALDNNVFGLFLIYVIILLIS